MDNVIIIPEGKQLYHISSVDECIDCGGGEVVGIYIGDSGLNLEKMYKENKKEKSPYAFATWLVENNVLVNVDDYFEFVELYY